MGLAEDLEMNRKQRMDFVRSWARYVATHPDKDWGRQQAMLIDSQLQNARHLMTKEQYLKMKGELK